MFLPLKLYTDRLSHVTQSNASAKQKKRCGKKNAAWPLFAASPKLLLFHPLLLQHSRWTRNQLALTPATLTPPPMLTSLRRRTWLTISTSLHLRRLPSRTPRASCSHLSASLTVFPALPPPPRLAKELSTPSRPPNPLPCRRTLKGRSSASLRLARATTKKERVLRPLFCPSHRRALCPQPRQKKRRMTTTARAPLERSAEEQATATIQSTSAKGERQAQASIAPA